MGRLTVGRGGQLTVQAGRKRIRFELAERVSIKVDVTESAASTSIWSIVSPGDQIAVRGVAVPNRQGMVQAQTIHVTLSERLTGDKRKAGKKSGADRAQSAKKDGKPFDPDAPDDDPDTDPDGP